MKRMIYPLSLILIITITVRVAAQEKLDDRMAFEAFLSLGGVDVEQYSDEYFYRFDEKQYQMQHEDEFERKRAINELVESCQGKFEKNSFYISTKANYGIYNFDSSQFGFKPFKQETVLDVCDYLFLTRLKTNTKITVAFLNGTEINALPMPSDKASFLVKMCKDKRTGEVDRTVHLKVIFKIDSIAGVEESGEIRKNVSLFAYITTIEIYHTSEYISEPLAIIETRYKRNSEQPLSQVKQEISHQDSLLEAITDMDKFLSSNKNINQEMKVKIIQMMLDKGK